MFHERFMMRCIELANNGAGLVSPNPLVGSVVVVNGEIVGEGYHHQYGGPHAEVNAINAVVDESLLAEATLYVSLEPCSHYGKTPPCTQLIIQKGIKRVVVGCEDVYAEVSGKGIAQLREAGVDVVVGVLKDEAKLLNKRFFRYHLHKRPYIILKWAQTQDGYIDVIREANHKICPTWISSENTRILVHKWRTEESAIIIGSNTVKKDNPTLDVRDWVGKNPIRLIVDPENTLNRSYNIFGNQAETYVFISKMSTPTDNRCVQIDFNHNPIAQILSWCYNQKLLSLIVEGGLMVHESFISEGFWDEARIFTNDKRFGIGIDAPKIQGNSIFSHRIGKDCLTIIQNPNARL